MTVSPNMELVRLGFDMFEREGPGAVSSVLALADSEVEVYAAPGIEPTGMYRGVQNVTRWAQEWFDAWRDFRMKPTEFIEIGDRCVVVPLHQTGTGKSSGVEVQIDVAYLFEIRAGRITRFHLYPDRAQALEAAERFASSE